MVGEPHAQKGSDGKDIKKVYLYNVPDSLTS